MLPCASERCEGGKYDELCSAAPTATKALSWNLNGSTCANHPAPTVSYNHVGSQSDGMQGGANVLMRVRV